MRQEGGRWSSWGCFYESLMNTSSSQMIRDALLNHCCCHDFMEIPPQHPFYIHLHFIRISLDKCSIAIFFGFDIYSSCKSSLQVFISSHIGKVKIIPVGCMSLEYYKKWRYYRGPLNLLCLYLFLTSCSSVKRWGIALQKWRCHVRSFFFQRSVLFSPLIYLLQDM